MSTRREALEAAFEEMEEKEAPNAPDEETTESLAPEGQQEPDGQEGTPLEVVKSGEGDKKVDDLPVGDEEKKTPPVGKKKDEALGRAAAAATGAVPAEKAPVSWKGTVKDQWGKLPVDVRQEVLRREKEISQYISQNDHHRKFSEGFTQTVRPFAHLIQAQGSTPLQAVRNLFTTAAGLTTGNSEQKARIVAEIISNYNVDIKTLDTVLSNGAPQQNQGVGAIPPAVAQAMQPIYGFMNEIQQLKQMREQRQQQEAMSVVEESSDLPYFDDLRDDMADLLDIAAKRGVEMTLQQAYEKAVAINPDISAAVSKQKAIAEAKANGGTRLARARRAASTITGAPAGVPGGSGKPSSRKEALESAWDEMAQQ